MSKIICDHILNDGSVTYLHHTSVIINTPALRGAVRAWHEMFQDRHLDASIIPISYDDEALWVSLKGSDPDAEPIGVMTFCKQWNNTMLLRLAWVNSDYRRNGIHTRMFGGLQVIARKRKVIAIDSATSIRNIPMQDTAKAQGRELVGYMYRMKV